MMGNEGGGRDARTTTYGEQTGAYGGHLALSMLRHGDYDGIPANVGIDCDEAVIPARESVVPRFGDTHCLSRVKIAIASL